MLSENSVVVAGRIRSETHSIRTPCSLERTTAVAATCAPAEMSKCARSPATLLSRNLTSSYAVFTHFSTAYPKKMFNKRCFVLSCLPITSIRNFFLGDADIPMKDPFPESVFSF